MIAKPELPKVQPHAGKDDRAGKWLLELPNEAYHADKTSLSRSGIFAGIKSPAHFRAEWGAPASTPTPAMQLGTLTHLATLQPDLYQKLVVTSPKFSGEGMRKAKADWLASLPVGAIVATHDEQIAAECMADSLRSHPIVRDLLKSEHLIEASGYWVDAETGILCRCRPDIVLADGILPDIKTTSDASPAGFARTIAAFRYDIQAAHYLAGVAAIQGKSGPWMFLAVEKEPPYACAVYVADEAMLARGRADRARFMRQLRQCIETDTWPAYATEARTISLPTWAFADAQEFSL